MKVIRKIGVENWPSIDPNKNGPLIIRWNKDSNAERIFVLLGLDFYVFLFVLLIVYAFARTEAGEN